MDGCKEICQRQTEMDKACRPMFQQEVDELRSKVRGSLNGVPVGVRVGMSALSGGW